MAEVPHDTVRRGAEGTVLLVDDSAELVRGLATLLRNAGYTVLTLPNGAAVVETVTVNRADLVVLDVMMPQVDGWEALRRLRENPATRDVGVLMLTAKGTEDAKIHGFHLGADDYLAKPFSVRELRCRVDALMRRVRDDGDAQGPRLQVVASGGVQFLAASDVYYVEGVRNYVYLHTYDARFLGRMSLGELDGQGLPGFKRVHRSYIVRDVGVKGYRWVSKSSFKLILGDSGSTEIPVSRGLVREVKGWLGDS